MATVTTLMYHAKQGALRLMLNVLVPDCCDVCSVVRGWKPWLGTAGFGVFLWAVMSGACGQEALYGMLHVCP